MSAIDAVGLAMDLPCLPAPTELDTVVLAALRPSPDEGAESFAARVHRAMQGELDGLAAGRVPVLGRAQH